MILSLSTSWISEDLSNAGQLIKFLHDLDVNTIELEYRLKADVYHQVKSILKYHRIRVSSVHNFCPFPAVRPSQGPSGDYFRLSALDVDERRLAVDWTIKTIEQANELEAPVVVLHCGSVEMDANYRAIRKLLDAGQERFDDLQRLIDAGLQHRQKKCGPFLDALLFSLDRMLPWAEKYDVILGLENRFHHHELPGHEEFAVIFKEFEGGPVGYWHDTGHAHAHEKLGIIEQKKILDSFGQKLVGVHLHDAIGLRDHLPPGSGEIDFNCLKPYRDLEIPLVLEIAPATARDQMIAAVAYGKKWVLVQNEQQE